MYYVEINLINGYSDSITDSVKLEKIQLIAGRTVADFSIFFLLGNLFIETGWETLYSRRKIPRLKTMYEIDRNILSIIFFTCYKYKDARNVLFHELFPFLNLNLNIANTHALLSGDSAIYR